MNENKSIRIRTTPGGEDKHVTVKLEQEFDFLEILSLKISQEDLYRSFCADYGVVVGRVIANKGFGLPNAKVSVFVPLTDEDEKNDLIKDLYPYKTPTDKNSDSIRYNLLLSKSTCSLNQAVGTFPTKEEVLNNDIVLEVFDKYYKYTTKTNSAGDYMIFGVPTGQKTIHMDVDLSDVSLASLRPYDLIADGAPEGLFESRTEFKTSTELDILPQIKSNNKGVDVIPFWGDSETCELGITRVDFDTQAQIKTSALFMGSIFTDVGKNSINKRCNPKNDMGEQDQLRTGAGKIEMIRATEINPNDWVQNREITPTELENFFIEGGDLIDDDGNFVTPLPMNLGHVVTDEFGDLVPSPDPDVGIATKGLYRFKMKFNEPPQNRKRRTANMIFPSLSRHHGGTQGYTSTGQVSNIGGTEDQRFTDNISDYKDIKKDFHLFEWKQVYTIANFIKKYKKGANRFSFLGLKNTDVSGETNLLPFNTAVYKYNIFFTIGQLFVNFVGILIRFLVSLTGLQVTLGVGGDLEINVLGSTIDVYDFCKWIGIRPFYFLSNLFPKLKDQDPTCPAYSGNNAPEDRGFVLSCDGNNYCINMTNPCNNVNISCGEYCDDIGPNDNGTFCNGDCSSNPCDTGIFYLKPDVFVPSTNSCTALSQIKDWQCCIVFGLAQNFNVIRNSFFDAWLIGSAYLFQYKYKSKIKNSGELKEKFCGPGSDTKGGNNYRKNQCCSHSKKQIGFLNKDVCDKCLIRGPYTTDKDFSTIDDYHKFWHNDSVNGDCGGQPCGNGATDMEDSIYCNSYASTKIVNIGRMEMCEDTVNDIEKCISAQNCSIDLYTQIPNFYTGTFYEDGWDPNFWVQSMEGSSYQDPREVILFLLKFTNCNVGRLFNNDSGCHEKELEDDNYKIYKELSKIQVESVLTEDPSGNEVFDSSVGINPTTGEGSGFIHNTIYGQRFNPCVDNNNCLPPPAPWSPNSTVLNTLVSDNQSIDYSFGSNYNPNKNIPYYYFGIIPGKTAIDKLRKDYFLNG